MLCSVNLLQNHNRVIDLHAVGLVWFSMCFVQTRWPIPQLNHSSDSIRHWVHHGNIMARYAAPSGIPPHVSTRTPSKWNPAHCLVPRTLLAHPLRCGRLCTWVTSSQKHTLQGTRMMAESPVCLSEPHHVVLGFHRGIAQRLCPSEHFQLGNPSHSRRGCSGRSVSCSLQIAHGFWPDTNGSPPALHCDAGPPT